jgi:Yip1 domain
MDNQETPASVHTGLINRVKNILLQPNSEWDVIERETADVPGLFKNYVMILAAIPPLANMIHGLVFGYSLFGISYRPGIIEAVGTAIVTYVVSLIAFFVVALVIDALAPQFGAEKNRIQAFKVAAYMGTASWVAGIFNLIPGLGFLVILGFYSLYLLYLGLPKLMKAPADQAMPYTVVTVIAAIVINVLAFFIVTPIAGLFAGSPASTYADGKMSGELSVPGVGKIDMGKLESAAKSIEQSASATPKPAIPVATLQALLPASLAGLPRGEISSASAGAAGIGGSNVEARYEQGESRITLQLTDMAALGAMAGIGAALGVETSKQDANGYEKVGSVDGRMTTEKWDAAAKSGNYSVMVANRFMVQADGSGTTMEALKGAVESVGIAKLEALAK